MTYRAVVNAGPLVALSLLDRLDILPILFREVWIPDLVFAEVAVAGLGRPGAARLAVTEWASRVVPSPALDPLLIAELDRGEASVIALARARAPCVAVIDERRGRRVAQQIYGLPVKGTVGLLVEGQRRGLVADLRQTLMDLKAAGYYLADGLVEAACRQTGEDKP